MINLKRTLINICLVSLFITVILIVIVYFIADMQFNSAKRLEEEYRWQSAENKYNVAVRLNPFNTLYISGLADFLRNKASYQGKISEITWLKEAQELYIYASKLNPHWAEYPLNIGIVKLRLYMLDNNKAIEDTKSIIDNFKKALKNDPKGFNTSYSIGYAGMEIWDRINPQDKTFILDRLKYCLMVDNSYNEHIYLRIFKITGDYKYLQDITQKTLEAQTNLNDFIKKNNLWQFRKKQESNLSYYLENEKPDEFRRNIEKKKAIISKLKETASKTSELWSGKSEDGTNEYKNGSMYWNGTINTLINVPKGKSVIKLSLRGSSADGVWPYMIVELEDEEIGEAFVEGSEWKDYYFSINTGGGLKVLSIIFVNDGGNEKTGEDRNLYVGEAIVEKYE